MLTTFILVRPQHPGNIGSAARALANFGFRSLRLVQPRVAPDHEDAIRLAVGGRAVLRAARTYPDLAAALRGCHFAIGTSRRRGKDRTLHTLATLHERIPQLEARQRIAVVFGSEEHGLHNDELAQCHDVVTIPSHDECPSLNLSHAVAVVAYELRRAQSTRKIRPESTPSLATASACEQMYTHLHTAFAAIGFFPHHKPTSVMRELRACLSRARLTPQEVRIFRGIARQIMWKLNGLRKT